MKRFKHIKQNDHNDCGPTCLRIVANWHGKNYDIDFLKKNCNINNDGVNLLDIVKAAELIGFKTLCVKIDTKKLDKVLEIGPCIIHWQKKHFVVLYKQKKSFWKRSKIYYISDPARGRLTFNEEIFSKSWKGNNAKGYCLLLEPKEDFYNLKF